MHWSDPKHPVWGIFKGLLACLALFIILYFSASTFDNTEVETVGWFGALYAILQGGHEFLKRFTGEGK